MEHQRRIGLPALKNIVTAKRQIGKPCNMPVCQRMLHLTDRSVGYHAHRRLNALNGGICARDRFQFGIEQTRNTRRGTPAQLRPLPAQRHALY